MVKQQYFDISGKRCSFCKTLFSKDGNRLAEGQDMRYFLENVLHRIKAGKRMYAFLFAELVAGVLILSVCMNALFTSEKVISEYAKTQMGGKTAITYNMKVDENSEDAYRMPVDYGMYCEIKKKYQGKIEFAYSALYVNPTFLMDYGEIASPHIYCMEDELFEELFPGWTAGRGETAYLGEEVWEFLTKAEKNKTFGDGSLIMFIRDGMLWIDGKETFPAKHLEEINSAGISGIPYIWANDGVYDLTDAVILPAAYAVQMEEFARRFGVMAGITQLKAGGVDGRVDFSILNNVVMELTKKCRYKVTFSVADQYLALEKTYEGLNWIVWYWFLIGAAVLLQVFVGLLGMLMLLQYRRRTGMAVCYICGSTGMRLHMELLCEIGSVLFLGTGTGNILAYFLIQKGVSEAVEIEFFGKSVVILMLLAVLTSLVSYGILCLYDRKVNYLTQLREDA